MVHLFFLALVLQFSDRPDPEVVFPTGRGRRQRTSQGLSLQHPDLASTHSEGSQDLVGGSGRARGQDEREAPERMVHQVNPVLLVTKLILFSWKPFLPQDLRTIEIVVYTLRWLVNQSAD